jgi:hypothetical protein
MSGPEYSSLEILELTDMWLAGLPPREIGRRLSGRSGATIYAKAQRLHLPPQTRVVPAKPEPQKLGFDDLQDVRLPRAQRKVMATLLAAHPYGLTHKEIGARAFGDDYNVSDPQANAQVICKRLDEKLKRHGWRCCPTGDRKGVKLHPVKEMAL